MTRCWARIGIALGVAAAFLFVSAPAALAVVKGFTLVSDPVIVGNAIRGKVDLTGNGDTIESYKWEIQRKVTGCDGPWASVGTGETSDMYYASTRGTYTIKLTVKYRKTSPAPAPNDTVLTKDVVVNPPTSVRVISGAKTEVALGGDIDLVLQLQDAAGNDCGAQLVGMPQELRVNTVFLNQSKPDWTNWTPASPGPDFYMSGAQIHDRKSVTVDPTIWALYNDGEVIGTYTQQIRLAWTDSCVVQHYNTITSLRITLYRKSATTWWQEVE